VYLPLKITNGGNFVPAAATVKQTVALFEFDAELRIDTVLAPTTLTVELHFILKYTAV
jgi:hypothetical protein